MSPNDVQVDSILATLRALRTYDVSAAHAQRLRDRCHRALETRIAPGDRAESSDRVGLGMTLRVIAGAWCALYLLETIRRAAEVYAF